MKRCIIWGVLFFPLLINAQIKATTEKGKEVILFDNGTWKYTDVLKSEAAENAVAIDTSVEKESPMKVLFFDVSDRLARFFGKEKGKVKGSSKVIIKNGQAKLAMQLDYPIGDANRYYGKVDAGIKVVLHTNSAQQIELYLNDNIQFKSVEKYNFSSYFIEMDLSAEQLSILSQTSVQEVEIFWKKATEKYKVDNEKFYIEAIKSIM